MLPSYWASILCRHSLHFSSLYTGCGRASCRKLLGEDPASSLRPPTTCVNAYLVLCPPCGDLLAYDHTSMFFFSQRNKNNNKKNSCIEWKKRWGGVCKVCCQKSWCSFFFLIPPLPPWVIIVFLQYHTDSSDITSKERYADADRSNCL